MDINVGKKIKHYRKQKLMTQVELATKLDKSESMIRKYESNVIEPSLSTLTQISEILDVSLYDLIEPDKNVINENDYNQHLGEEFIDQTIKELKSSKNAKFNDALLIALDKYSLKPSDFKRKNEIKEEMTSKYLAIENLLENKYYQQEYDYDINELSCEEIGELHAFISEMLKLKIIEIKSKRNNN